MNYLEILDKIKSHISTLFASGQQNELRYHNISHTEKVAEYAARMANHYQLSDKDFFTVMAASWFHDVGYLEGKKGHEALGADEASAYLRTLGLDEAHIAEITGCILATRMPQQPKGLLQEIVCDADLFHLGTSAFKDCSKALRKELEQGMGQVIDKERWRAENIRFLQAHHFHTSYANEHLNPVKKRNLESLLQKEKEPRVQPAIAEVPVKQEKKSKKEDRPDKGIETMFRVTSANHQRLSDMADNKSHIMISTNSIILSVILSILLRKLEDNPHLILPTVLLLITCVVTMVFSILATRPAIPSGTFSREDVTSKRVNLLFFGNFYRMPLSDFQEGMHEVMDDREFLYNSLIKDLHGQGVVLGRKYRLLRMGYNVFMYGIVVSVVAFILASIYVAY